MSPELLGSIFSGVVLIIGALATYTAARSRRVGEDSRHLRRAYRTLEKRFLAAVRHIFRLEELLALRGVEPPKRPAELEASDDDDDAPIGPTPRLPPQPASEAGHGG